MGQVRWKGGGRERGKVRLRWGRGLELIGFLPPKGCRVFSHWAKRRHSSAAVWRDGGDGAAPWVMYNPHYLAFRLGAIAN